MLNLSGDLGLKHSNPVFHSILRFIMMHHHVRFACESMSSSEDIAETVTFDYINLQCNMTLKTANQSFA